MTAPAERDQRRPPDRRARRRAETITEILDRALAIMNEDGVAGLTMTGLARAMRIQPPSLYRRGQEDNLAALRAGMAAAEPGWAALRSGLGALGRWAVANPVLAQLLFWRPVPGFRPSPDAFAAAHEIVELLRGGLRDAVAAGQLAPTAASERALALLSTLHFGVLSQHLANDPEGGWETGTYTSLHATVLDLFEAAHRPGEPRPPFS
jgi:Tetracyclin repressor-like, C-terminal domain